MIATCDRGAAIPLKLLGADGAGTPLGGWELPAAPMTDGGGSNGPMHGSSLSIVSGGVPPIMPMLIMALHNTSTPCLTPIERRMHVSILPA